MSRGEMVLSKVAAVAAFLVAIFPCRCGDNVEVVPFVHGTAAAVMFVILAVFCFIFRSRALAKGYRQAKLRAATYAVCAGAIVLSIAVIALDHLLDGSITAAIPRLIFLGENLALVAFGIAWLFASRVLPFISSSEERFSPFTGREGR
jgi:hypothetical protein